MSQDSSHFASHWLSLREPVDATARSANLVDRLDAWLAGYTRSSLLDLGAGHGSNLRYLAPRLSGRQQWLLIDQNPDLLENAAHHSPAESTDGQPISVQCRTADLNELSRLNLPCPDVVTASAVLDLCSREWILALVGQMARWRCAGLFSLNVDGQRHFIDTHDRRLGNKADERMTGWFNDHQRQAKGLGLALGPDAVGVLATELQQAGFKVIQESTPWRLSAGDLSTTPMAQSLVNGWRQAALDIAPEQADFIQQWHQDRLDGLARGKAGLVVGHIDVLALPPGQHD